MEYWKRPHNKPISVAIIGYMNKTGGKVTASRKEIERRFDALDWKYQKQILFAFLQSGATDREWAYRKLYTFWDKCFLSTLQGLWVKYHEKTLSWLVIQFFPIDYVKSHFEELSVGRNYFFLYKRMADDKDFILDKTRLNEADLLHVRRSLGETITDGDIVDLFFLLIYKLCKGTYNIRFGRIVNYIDENPIISMFDNHVVRAMMNEIESGQCGLCKYKLAEDLRNWMYMVSKDYMKEHKANEAVDYLYPQGDHNVYDRINSRMKAVCYKQIPLQYTSKWEAYDISDQQCFLNDLDERHIIHLQNLNDKKTEL